MKTLSPLFSRSLIMDEIMRSALSNQSPSMWHVPSHLDTCLVCLDTQTTIRAHLSFFGVSRLRFLLPCWLATLL